MNFKEAYIDKLICHHFSIDRQKCIVNHKEIDMTQVNPDFLKDFFIKPFTHEKTEYSFVHSVDLKYNVTYNTVLDIYNGGDFVKNSISLFKHLDSVSTSPTIKDGDIFIVKIEDVLVDETYCDAVGIFKIETKNEFIETNFDMQGNMNISVKAGYIPQKIDRACMIIFTESMPVGLVIDKSKDPNFWKQDFLGLATRVTPYTQSKNLMGLMENFVRDRLSKSTKVTKSEQIELINKCVDFVSTSKHLEMNELQRELFKDCEVLDMFQEYRKMYEEQENLKIENMLTIDNKAVTVSRKIRKIKLDDTVELYLMKTGQFIERGFDETRGQYYYKIYFSKEK